MELSYTNYIPSYNTSISFYGEVEDPKLHRNKTYVVLPYINETPKKFEKCLFFKPNKKNRLYFFEMFSENKKKYNTCIHNKKLSNNRFETKEDAEYCIINWLASRGGNRDF